MKALSISCLFILLGIPFYITAQTTPSPWHWGVGAGLNTLWIPKGGGDLNLGIAADEKEASIDRVGNRVGFQINGNIGYQFNRRWSIIGGLGLTKAQSKAYRKIHHEGYSFWVPIEYTSIDTISLKLLLLDIKLHARFQIVTGEKAGDIPKFFLDFGALGEVPLSNNSRFSYDEVGRENAYLQGKLKLFPLSPYLAIGSLIGEKADWSIGFAWLIHEREQGDHTYSTILTRLTLHRYF